MGADLIRRCGAAGVLLVIISSGRSQAGPREDKGHDLTPTARELSDQGLRHYQRGELDDAIEAFMGAFAISGNAGLLFNVAQAYRLKGDCASAKDYYRRYLDAVPETALKPSVERRLGEMASCLAASAPAAGAAPGPAGAEAAVAPPPAPDPAAAVRAAPVPPAALARTSPPAPPASHPAVWALRGSAAALLISSAVLGALAWDARRDFDGTPYQGPAWDANDRYKLDSTLAWSFAASGVACAVASFLLGRRP
jgi:hypothetical protein